MLGVAAMNSVGNDQLTGHLVCRFFFKTTCDDPDNPVIQVEIDNDGDLLPLLDGKVDCKVKEYE